MLWVGAGGFVGSVLRFGVGTVVERAAGGSLFPYGILAVNLLGCAVIGLMSGIAEARGGLTNEMRLFVVVGLLGGFTTYSSFANDGISMLRSGALGSALASVALHIFVGFGAVWAGWVLTHALTRTG